MQQASSPRLTRLRKESAIAGSDRYSSRDASARPIRKSGRGATRRGPQAGARAAHRGHTHTQHTYVRAHVSGSLRAGTKRQGYGRHRRTYCQGGDSDWAALRALRAVEARPDSWAKIASTHESGISFGRRAHNAARGGDLHSGRQTGDGPTDHGNTDRPEDARHHREQRQICSGHGGSGTPTTAVV